MPSLSSSDDDDGSRAFFSAHGKQMGGTRRSMKSLFAADDMQARQGVTSLRYEDQTHVEKKVSLPVAGAPPNAPSPLQTAAQSVAMAYKGDACIGPCVVALCVPHANAPPAAVALIALVDREKRAQCRVRLDAHLQLLQNPTDPQYATLYDPAFSGHWSLMFRDRRACTEFVAAVMTAQHCADSENAAAPLFADWGQSVANAAGPAVRKGDSVTISSMTWIMRRVPNTHFFALGKLIEEVPPEAPRDMCVGLGEMMSGVEEALVGLTREAARLVFVSPQKTHVRQGMRNPEIATGDTVVVHITCHDVQSGKEAKAKVAPAITQAVSADADAATPAPQAPEPNPPTALNADPNTLLQTILLQTLQQQQQQQKTNTASGGGGGGAVASMESVERSIDRVQMQLSSLYEKIDRLAIDEKLAHNNAAIARIVKIAVGKAPAGDGGGEGADGAAEDRDALLATIERLRRRADDAGENYERALAALGRGADEAQRLQSDLRAQRDAHEARVQQMQESARLQRVEAEVRHRDAIEKCAEEQFRAGREKGFEEGAKQGRREAMEECGAHSGEEWKERLFKCEQRAMAVETEMHEREARYNEERRRMLDEASALRETVARLGRITAEKGAGDYNAPVRIAQRRKQLRRALNAVYTNAEAQMSAASTENALIPVEDALRILFIAVKSESKVFLDEIAKEAELHTAPEAAPPEEQSGAMEGTEERPTGEAEDRPVGTTEEGATERIEEGAEESPAVGSAKENEEGSKIEWEGLPPAPPPDIPAVFFGSGEAGEFPDPPVLTLHENEKTEWFEKDNE